MAKLYFASLVTLSLLTAMVAGVVISAMVATGSLDTSAALVMVLIINSVLFFISPWLTDVMLRWVNQLTWLEDSELKTRYPHVHRIVQDVAREYRFKAPTIGIIPDRNPTAFTYGIFRGGARVVLTDGIFEFLNEEETRAVVAHELGHIVNRDFLVMTVAGMLVQMLYVLYSGLTRQKSGGGNSKGKSYLAIIGFVSYVMYVLGTYILLYLSRTREYLADRFSSEYVEARHLANALVKIAYGIAEATDTDQTRELLASTRHMGVMDFKGASHLGLVVEASKSRPEATANAMLFDVYNPWAKLVELSSTHPLTGKRIQALADIAREKRQAFQEIDIEAAARAAKVDRGALWRKFLRELALPVLPTLTLIAGVSYGLFSGSQVIALLAVPAMLLAWALLIPLTYPFSPPVDTDVASLMGDVAASPIVGRPVRLRGEVIGRANAGSVIGEDTIFGDTTGRTTIDFRSLWGTGGDIWAGLRRIKPHIGAKGEVTGWFRRSMGGYVIISELNTTAGRLKAYPYLVGVITPLIVYVVFILLAREILSGKF